jgi:conjugal transfer pilus assembly protein TraU
MTRYLNIACVMMIVLPAIMAQAGARCHGHMVNPINDVCWSCLFPISIGGAPIHSGHYPDTPNPNNPVCSCPGSPLPKVGLSMGYWAPMALVDVTRTPFCMVNMGGTQLARGTYYPHGTVSHYTNQNTSFYHVHWYRYPLLAWLNLLTDGACGQNGTMDVAYLSEVDPAWYDDELNILQNPEAALFGNPLTQAACAADSLAATAYKPLDHLFWCLGAQGASYPLAGRVQEHVGGVQASTLLTERTAYLLHRRAQIWESVGRQGFQLCHMMPMPILPKSRYRYQMVHPVPTSQPHGCHPFGRSTAIWGAAHEYPVKGEDFGYLVWRKRNCCAF